MKYYVVSDVHSFYSEMMAALNEKGFFEDSAPHKLIICGDLFDRGDESLAMQKFVTDLIKKDEVILPHGAFQEENTKRRTRKRVRKQTEIFKP